MRYVLYAIHRFEQKIKAVKDIFWVHMGKILTFEEISRFIYYDRFEFIKEERC